jgi:hypothetical protein
LCQFYGACKNKQGLWRKKSHVNWINGCEVMPQKQKSFVFGAARAAKKLFIFWVGYFFVDS